MNLNRKSNRVIDAKYNNTINNNVNAVKCANYEQIGFSGGSVGGPVLQFHTVWFMTNQICGLILFNNILGALGGKGQFPQKCKFYHYFKGFMLFQIFFFLKCICKNIKNIYHYHII